MSIEHKNIVDPNIHEPKGIATATAGQIYVANGASSGSWEDHPDPVLKYAALSLGKTSNNATATTITAVGTYYPVGGTFTEEDTFDMTTTAASGRINISTAGTYEFVADISMISSRSSAVVAFSFLVDGVATGPRIRRKIGTGADVGACSIHAIIPDLAVNKYIQIGVTLPSGEGGVNGDTVTVENCSFSGHLLEANV